ncbi:hypothetical protein Aduo_006583 [Ancylostoma duodenale]
MECLMKVAVAVLLLSYHFSNAKAIRRATSQGSSPFVSLLSGISREARRNDRSGMDRTGDYEDYESTDDRSTNSGKKGLGRGYMDALAYEDDESTDDRSTNSGKKGLGRDYMNANAFRRATSQGSSPFVSLLSGISREAGRNDRSGMDRTGDYEDYESTDDRSTNSGKKGLGRGYMDALAYEDDESTDDRGTNFGKKGLGRGYMKALLKRGSRRGLIKARPDYSDYNYDYSQDQMNQYDYRSDVGGAGDDPDDFDDEEGKGSGTVGLLLNKLRQGFRGNVSVSTKIL